MSWSASTGTQRAPSDSWFVTAVAPGGASTRCRTSRCRWSGSCPRRSWKVWTSRSTAGVATRSPVMPVSSSASRSATRARLASPSACPPGCSHRCTLAWKRKRTWRVLGSTTAAEPVRWPSRHDRWSASGCSSMKVRIRRRFSSCVASPGRASSTAARATARSADATSCPDVCSALMLASRGGAIRGCTSATGARCPPSGRSAWTRPARQEAACRRPRAPPRGRRSPGRRHPPPR